MDTARLTQKEMVTKLAERFGKKVKHEFGFEALFDPWHLVMTLDLAFCRSINFEFVLKSKINQYTTDSGGEVFDPKSEKQEEPATSKLSGDESESEGGESEPEQKSDLDGISYDSQFSVEASLNESVVEVDESLFKWGQGFVENIELVVDEFLVYRRVYPLNVLFLNQSSNAFFLKSLKEVCAEMNIALFSKELVVAESESWPDEKDEELRAILREVHQKKRQILEEVEQQARARDAKKKKPKVEPQLASEESQIGRVISNEQMSRVMEIRMRANLGIYVKGAVFFNVCDNFNQFAKIYSKGFFKKLAYVVELSLNTMDIEDFDRQESKRHKTTFRVPSSWTQRRKRRSRPPSQPRKPRGVSTWNAP